MEHGGVVRGLLHDRGADVDGLRLLLFGRSGFDRQLRDEAARRDDVVLVDLDRFYGS